MRFSAFLDGVVAELEGLYGRDDLAREEKLGRREAVFEEARARLREIQPTLEATTFRGFLEVPLNNATLLARMRYFHRLGEFGDLMARQDGSLAAAVEVIERRVGGTEDPFAALAPPL